MHFSNLVVSAILSSSAFGLAVPQAEDNKHIKRFDVPGASIEDGFTIPKDTLDGFYRVHIGDDGVAHHTKVDMNPKSLEESDATSPALNTRQSWRVSCEGSSLNRSDADRAVGLLRDGCGSGYSVEPRDHYYVISGRVASYFATTPPDGPLAAQQLFVSRFRKASAVDVVLTGQAGHVGRPPMAP